MHRLVYQPRSSKHRSTYAAPLYGWYALQRNSVLCMRTISLLRRDCRMCTLELKH